jgi:hypothetical protein
LRHEDLERLSRKERYEYFSAWARRAVDTALAGKVTKVDILVLVANRWRDRRRRLDRARCAARAPRRARTMTPEKVGGALAAIISCEVSPSDKPGIVKLTKCYEVGR